MALYVSTAAHLSGCGSLASVKSRLVLPFWYRLTWVVPDKEPLNGCVWCLQAKLELVAGAPCNSMVVEVYGKDDKFICCLDDNDALVGSYPIDDGARLHVWHSLLVTLTKHLNI